MHTQTPPSRPDAAATADWLLREHAARTPFHPFAQARGIRSLADAYRVQEEYVRLLQLQGGQGVAGYKVGLTSKAMQAMCGIDSPVAGVVLQDRVHASGVRVQGLHYGRFGVEFEIAVRIGRDVVHPQRPCTVADVAPAIAAVAPAMEIVDDRGCDYGTLDVLSLVADNAWNAGIVLGEFVDRWPDLAEVEGSVEIDGTVHRGMGRDVLGHPLAAVAWLADHLHSQGQVLRAGDVVMTGSMVTTKFPGGPQAYRFDVTGLGAVSLAFEME